MYLKLIRSLLLMGMVFCVSGCASFLTLMSPVQSEIVVGEKSVGDFNKYQYQYKIRSNQIVLSKVPLCTEKARAYRKAQKREIGYGPALLEMPFFGLGLIDMVNAYAIADDSKKQYPLAEYETGELLTCGSPEPAAGEAVIIENKQRTICRKGFTDSNGILDLDTILSDISGAVRYTVYLESDHTVRFSYVYAGTKLAGKAPAKTNLYKN